MRYILPVSDTTNFDFETLKGEIRGAGIDLVEIYAGNGVLVFEIAHGLTDGQKDALGTVVAGHTPVWFEGLIVRCAEDVDRITAMRIRNAVGGEDAVQEQLKQMRMLAWAHDVQLNPSEYTSEDMTRAQGIRTQLKALNAKIEGIRQEGKDFKQARGW